MKRLFTAALSAALLLSLALPSSAAGTGRAVDWALYTDITAQINGHPLRSYNVNGSTAVVAEDPRAYLEERGLPLTKVQIEFNLLPERRAVEARCTVKTSGVTGVEMEALTGVSTALLTIYDMCKAVDKGMELGEIHLVEKTGGKSGHYIRAEGGYV